MNDPTDEPDEGPRIFADKLLLLRGIWFDHRKPDYGYSLLGVYTHIQPAEGFSFPVRLKRMFVYFQVWGDLGDYRFRIRLVRYDRDDDNGDGETEVQLHEDGEPLEFPMPTSRPVEITGLNYIQEVSFPIFDVPFDVHGAYEFQLWADGIEGPIARERLLALE